MATRPGRSRASSLFVACLLCLSTALLPAGWAGAGLRIVLEIEGSSDAGPGAQNGVIWIDGQRLRIELRAAADDADDPSNTLIFRGDRKLLWILDPASRTYMEIARADLEPLAERLAAARAEVDARLASLPADERALVERMLPATRPVSREPEAVRNTDERREIDGRPARRLDLIREQQTVGEVWVTDWKVMGVKRRELRVFRSLAGFQRDLLRAVGRRPEFALTSQPFEIFDDLGGFPLLIRRFETGAAATETRFTRVEQADLDTALFEVPPAFTQTTLP